MTGTRLARFSIEQRQCQHDFDDTVRLLSGRSCFLIEWTLGNPTKGVAQPDFQVFGISAGAAPNGFGSPALSEGPAAAAIVGHSCRRVRAGRRAVRRSYALRQCARSRFRWSAPHRAESRQGPATPLQCRHHRSKVLLRTPRLSFHCSAGLSTRAELDTKS